MPQILKPANLSLTWASAGDVLDPGDSKYQTGWVVEVPPRQWFNYLDNRQDTAIAHINQHGISEWDSTTEYQGIKSYVQGSNGTIYRSKQTNTNQEPVADASGPALYWEIAFASAGDFYTKTETDGLYLAKAQNLADLTNAATARTNLSVYSQAQTYTKTEVDAKTTVASTAQAQAWTSNTTLITPLRLAEAFQGANRSHLASGYQMIPGGLILQWGFATNATTAGAITNFPIAFPSNCFTVYTNDQATSSAVLAHQGVSSLTTTGFTVYTDSNPNGPNYYWFAIGN